MIASFFNESPTELTTGVTDAVLAVECFVIIVCLQRIVGADRWRTSLWCWVFGLMGISSVLGAVVHGLMVPHSVREVLWRPLILCLGVLVAISLSGAVYDWRGRSLAVRLLPWCIGAGFAFFGLNEALSGAFFAFVAYEAIVTLAVFSIYVFLCVSGRLRGAGIVATALLINMLAAGVQASEFSLHLWVPFDHNGVFHLIQMVGTGTLGFGLALGMNREASDA